MGLLDRHQGKHGWSWSNHCDEICVLADVVRDEQIRPYSLVEHLDPGEYSAYGPRRTAFDPRHDDLVEIAPLVVGQLVEVALE